MPEPRRTGGSALREKGYRLTPQRELILAAVDELGHATPDEVLAHVQQQASTVNVSTVYRTLEVLEELGLVRHAHLTDRAPTYHSTARARALPPRLPRLPQGRSRSTPKMPRRSWNHWPPVTRSPQTWAT